MRDVRLAFRTLRAAPVVSAVVILSLALGIGANTAIFSIVDALILRTLPVREPDRLMMVVDAEQPGAAWSNPVWEQLRARLDLFESGLAWGIEQFNLAPRGEAWIVPGLWVSGSFFDTLGVSAFIGRTITTADDLRGGGPDGPVAVISYAFWQREFGGSPTAIGRTLNVGQAAFTVVGVTPPDFFGPDVGRGFDVALPINAEPMLRGSNSEIDSTGQQWLRFIVRLRPDQTIEVVNATLRELQPQIRAATSIGMSPQRAAGYMKRPLTLEPAARGRSALRARFERPLVILMAVVGLVLLIACSNVANLLLARAAGRRREVSVQLALGASRTILVRQFLIESFFLAGAGAALGLLFAGLTSQLLVSQLSTGNTTAFLDTTLDWRMLAFTAAVAGTTALLFGTAPAWLAVRVVARESLGEQTRSVSAPRSILPGMLVGVQIALSLVLLVAAGLFVRTFAALTARDPGFTSDRLLTVNITPPMTRFTADQLMGLYERSLEAVATVPGVERASLSDLTPISGAMRTTDITIPGLIETGSGRVAFVNVVSPGWFTTYGTRLLAGRDFDDRDRRLPRVAVVNEAFARQFFNGQNPIGQIFYDGVGASLPIEIVGLTADAAYNSLRESAPPTIYTPFAQRPLPRPFVSITVRAVDGRPEVLTNSITTAIGGVSPELSLRFRMLTDQVDDSLNQERLVAMLAGFFGGLGLLLAGLGMYGVTAHSVSRRRGELGIRIALGAASAGIVTLVLRRVAFLIVAGIALGAALTWWATRFVAATLLYGLQPRDTVTFAGAAVTLAAVGILAGWLPARRAARIDPMVALRAE